MQIVLLRHGQTPGNREKRYIGRTDEPLSEAGIAAARAVGSLGAAVVPRVYVSPLLRARQTASIAFPQAEQVLVDGLREMDFGVFENHSYQELSQHSDYQAWVNACCETPCPQGESKDEFTRRVAHAVRTLLKQAFAAGDEQLVIVAHGGTVMAAMDSFTCAKGSYYSWHVENCEGYRARVEQTLLGSFEFEDCQKITTKDVWGFAPQDIR